jgi:hypothetical protein
MVAVYMHSEEDRDLPKIFIGVVSASPFGEGEQSASCPTPRPVNVWSFTTISYERTFPMLLLRIRQYPFRKWPVILLAELHHKY